MVIKICPKCKELLILKRISPYVKDEVIYLDAYICNNNNCDGGTFK